MNAERLLQHYGRIADAPDAIARLRRFILDLAVHGKLVPQDEPWKISKIEGCLEPLSDGRFIHQGWSPQCESHPSLSDTIWGVLKTTAIQDGFFLVDQNKQLPEKLQPKPNLAVRAGDILITCAGPRARCGIVCLVKETRERLMLSGKMYRFRANEKIISREYLELFLRSEKAKGMINSMKTGSSESGLNLTQDRFRTLEVPFGSLPEQRRIVAKVDELMGLCDRLEAAREAREATRDRLAAASLARLNAPYPDTFKEDARFALDALPALTTRPDQIRRLRHTILNLAVRGKLVPQDVNEEPGSELLKRIAIERAELVKRKEIRRENPLDPIQRAEISFDVPASWVWSRIGDAVLFTQYGTSQKSNPSEKGVPVLTMGNIQEGLVVWGHEKRISEASEELPALYLRKFDLLYNRTNSAELVGKTGIYLGDDNARTFASYLIRLRPSLLASNPRFLNIAMNTSEFRETQIVPLIKKQTGQANVNGTALKNMLIPLPPLAEQHRIVAKVDELMAFCDQLEASLTMAASVQQRLLEALLSEALSPNALEQAAA